MKKALFVLALATVIVLSFAGTAFANFGPHGGYAEDTDACAGCHRAHTSFSSVTWTDVNNRNHSALLVSSATTMLQFCYACHGEGVPGASTNVEMGVFDAGPSGADGQTVGFTYQTNSTFNAELNGGGFTASGMTATTSMHNMDVGTATDPMWGAGNTVAGTAGVNLTCTNCHDPHGSSNYRLLKDQVNGHTVGGYAADGVTPQPYVISSEEGYPIGGWQKHNPGALQMQAYFPNYTSPEYAYGGTDAYGNTEHLSISTWCSACHEAYDDKTGVYDYEGYEAVDVQRVGNTLTPGTGTALGARNRHRHPVNIPIDTVRQDFGWGSDSVTSAVLPLEKRQNYTEPRGTWTRQDYLGCLTCHRAHGTSATMTGWAEAKLVTSATAVTSWYPELLAQPAGDQGVNPNFSSALLRTNNRGVCERCHNK